MQACSEGGENLPTRLNRGHTVLGDASPGCGGRKVLVVTWRQVAKGESVLRPSGWSVVELAGVCGGQWGELLQPSGWSVVELEAVSGD